MGFVNKLAHVLGVKGITEPLIRKDIEESTKQLQELYHLALRVKSEEIREEIYKDMLFFQIGHDGEKSVMFELKNSSIPMFVLHDIRLETHDRSAQIDFVVITHEFIMLLEAKKLSGNIEITAEGEFIRRFKTYGKRGGYRDEGIYSPVVQNERHVDLVNQILKGAGIIKNVPILSTIVIANPKSIINRKKAPESISKQITKIDQLTSKIKKNLGQGGGMPEETMVNIYKYMLGKHTPKQYDLMEKYGITINELNEYPEPTLEETAAFMKEYKHRAFGELKSASTGVENVPKPVIKQAVVNTPTDDRGKVGVKNGELKSYRLLTSKKEGIPPYYIFNDAELELLMKQKPQTMGELGKIKGFGPKKLEKYGQDILNIIKKM